MTRKREIEKHEVRIWVTGTNQDWASAVSGKTPEALAEGYAKATANGSIFTVVVDGDDFRTRQAAWYAAITAKENPNV
jgi:hypothetical protein